MYSALDLTFVSCPSSPTNNFLHAIFIMPSSIKPSSCNLHLPSYRYQAEHSMVSRQYMRNPHCCDAFSSRIFSINPPNSEFILLCPEVSNTTDNSSMWMATRPARSSRVLRREACYFTSWCWNGVPRRLFVVTSMPLLLWCIYGQLLLFVRSFVWEMKLYSLSRYSSSS